MVQTPVGRALTTALLALGTTVSVPLSAQRDRPAAGLAVSRRKVVDDQPSPSTISVTVSEGTSMAVTRSPDGRFLAIDLQGSVWTLPAAGGTATRITDPFNDARQPTWSPDGRWIAFQGFRDGGYDIWAVAPDGTGLHRLTWGPADDREPIWSHDGTRVAFSSDRGQGGAYHIWTLDVAHGELRQITSGATDEYMPTWSPDDREIAFIAIRDAEPAVWAVATAGGTVRRLSPPGVRADAPSWGPGGQIVYHAAAAQSSRFEVDGRPLTGDENAFPFRVSWSGPSTFVYTSDGKIRERSLGGGDARTIEFRATLSVTPARYTRRPHDVDSRAPRRVLGIVHPVLSPDGRRVAFSALGDLWLMTIGDAPRRLTNDRFLDTDPAWSPDGTRLVFASDRAGGRLDLWIRDIASGTDRRLTTLPTAAMNPAWSPDGTRIAFLDVDGIWRRANVSVVDVATGAVTRIHESIFGPGAPTWSADGTRIAIAALVPYAARFREGTNQILSMAARPVGEGDDRWFTPVANLSIDSRYGAGPVWSPDGTQMAVIYEGALAVVPVSTAGAPLGPPRRLTREMAHAPSWSGDSKHLLYQSMDSLRLLDLESGSTRTLAVDLRYTPAIPTTRYVVHAGRLVDGTHPAASTDVDITIEGNRIRAVAPHAASAHAGTRVIDASGLTVMPGLIEYHAHQQQDFGEAHDRAYLAFGITTVRSPGGTPYEAVEDRETIDAGAHPGPRLFVTGYLLEWQRTYYKMAVAISSPAHLEMELARARALQHDMIKSYVRMPDLQQARIVAFAHGIGVPASSHEIYPSAFEGIDGVEHVLGTSRRGYSPKVATLQRSYDDVSAIIGAAGMTLTPTLSLSPTTLRHLLEASPELREDARFGLYPAWLRAQVTGGSGRGGGGGGRGGRGGAAPADATGPGELILRAMRAGARIVAGTDTPNAANLHAELLAYVTAGMTPFEALRTATVNPAAALGLDAGAIAPGKLADLVVVDGNPLEDIGAAHRVRRVIANGRLYELPALLAATPTP